MCILSSLIKNLVHGKMRCCCHMARMAVISLSSFHSHHTNAYGSQIVFCVVRNIFDSFSFDFPICFLMRESSTSFPRNHANCRIRTNKRCSEKRNTKNDEKPEGKFEKLEKSEFLKNACWISIFIPYASQSVNQCAVCHTVMLKEILFFCVLPLVIFCNFRTSELTSSVPCMNGVVVRLASARCALIIHGIVWNDIFHCPITSDNSYWKWNETRKPIRIAGLKWIITISTDHHHCGDGFWMAKWEFSNQHGE